MHGAGQAGYITVRMVVAFRKLGVNNIVSETSAAILLCPALQITTSPSDVPQ